MIRPGTRGDIEVVAALGEEFHREANWSDICEYVADDSIATLGILLESGILLVAEEENEIVGMAGALVFPFYFNTSHITGNELFLWVRPDRRGSLGARLLKALETEAKARGCKSFSMQLLEAIEPGKTEKFYLRNGYRPAERTFMKVL